MARHRDSATSCRTANSGFDSRQKKVEIVYDAHTASYSMDTEDRGGATNA